MRHSTEEIEKIISAFLPKEEGYPKRGISAMNYAVLAGGKRIRPLLMLLAYEMYAGERKTDGEKSCPVDAFMAAIEMIHTYSLIHDDLPALDNDDLRRGRPTVHVAYDEATAVLAGDALLNYAYRITTRVMLQYPGNEAVERALVILADLPGLYGMLGGQMVDCELTGKPLDADALSYIYENKTSALLECSLLCGATLGGAGEKDLELLKEIGYCAGLAFQVQDDILDVEGDRNVIGKPVGSDEKNEKYTYVTMHGMERAKEFAEEMTARAMRNLDALSVNYTDAKKDLSELLLLLIKRDR